MNELKLNQILFYILIIELTDFETQSKSRLNTLSISILGGIKKSVTKQLFIDYLSRLLFHKISELKTIIIVDINKELSEKLNPNLIGKKYRYSLNIKQTEIIIKEIIEVGKNQNYLKTSLLLTA